MTWPLPVELVEELATSTGQVLLFRARMQGARTAPLATVSRCGRRYVAEIGFLEPLGPERQTSIVVILRVPVGGLRPAAVDADAPSPILRRAGA